MIKLLKKTGSVGSLSAVLLFTSFLCSPLAGPFAIPTAQADSYLGVLLGPSFVNHDLGTDFDIGGHFGTAVAPGLSVGFYGTHQSLSSDSVASVGETTLALEANIRPAGTDMFYVGGKAGLGITSSSFLGASGSSTDFVFGPAVGVNVPLAPSVLIGVEGNVLFLEASQTVTFVNVLGGLTLLF